MSLSNSGDSWKSSGDSWKSSSGGGSLKIVYNPTVRTYTPQPTKVRSLESNISIGAHIPIAGGPEYFFPCYHV